MASHTSTSDRTWNIASLNTPLDVAILTCLTAAISFIAVKMAGTLVIRPQMIWSLWPGNVLVVSVLLLVRRRMWPILITAAFAAFVVSDLQEGIPLRSISLLILSDTVEVLIAAFCLNYSFDGVPQLNSVKALAKYSLFAVILAPLAGSIICAFAIPANYWTALRISFFTEALGFLVLMPAILGWLQKGRAWAHNFRNYYLEIPALLAALILFGYLAFESGRRGYRPVLLYSLIPFLLWAALRFGATGVSTSMIVIAFLSVRGAVHGVGPFTNPDPVVNLMSLQSFLFLSAALFMVVAVLVEERNQTHGELLEAHRVARLGSWSWDPVTDAVTWSEELYHLAGYDARQPPPTLKNHQQLFTPESWDRLRQKVEWTMQTGAPYELDLEGIRRDGTRVWLTSRGESVSDASGRIIRLRGTMQDISGRKRAEQAMLESEERFRLVANTAPALIWMAGPDKLCTFFNQGWLDFTGRTLEQELGQGWASGVYPDDLERCLGTYAAAFDSRVQFEMEYRLRRYDGKYRWIIDYGVPRFESDGNFLGYIGSCVDITDRKLSEEALLGMSGRLITAHEEERARIARELHDDFSQRLALQGIGLGQLWKKLPESEVEARAKVQELLKGTQELSSDMHSLSHELHSSRLEHVGLAPALIGLCEEITSKYHIQVGFTERGASTGIPKDVALCLFRVAQEALSNMVKHSRAKQAQAELIGVNNEIRLRVVDSGVGFDSNLPSSRVGIGLIGMRERLRLVGGTLSVASAPLKGTEILAQVPLSVLANEPTERTQAGEGRANGRLVTGH